MANEYKNVRRVQGANKTDLSNYMSSKMLGQERATKKLGFFSTSSTTGDPDSLDWYTPDGGDADFNTIKANFALDGNVKADANGQLYVEEDVLGSQDYIDFTPQSFDPTELEGRLFYDNNEKTWRGYTDNPDFLNWMNNANIFLATNETGATIPKGTIVDIHDINTAGNGYKMHVADSLHIANNNDEGWVLAITTKDALDGDTITVATRGTLLNIDTSGLTPGKQAYLGRNGALTSTRPNYPEKPILIGGAIVSHATNGVIGIAIADENYDAEFDGCIPEKHNTNIYESGGNIYMDVRLDDDTLYATRDMPVQIGGQTLILNTTSGDSTNTGWEGSARIQLLTPTNVGDDPTFQTIYIDNAGGTANLKVTSGYPPLPYAVVAIASIHHPTDFATIGGPWMHRRLTSSKAHDSRGRISYFTERFSVMPPEWWEDNTPTAEKISGSPDELRLTTQAGKVYQTHLQDTPLLSTNVDGIFVGNRAANTMGGPKTYDKITNLFDVCGYTSGDASRDTNARGHLTIIEQVNKDTGECRLVVNLPSTLYAGNDTQAYKDYNGYADRTVSKTEKQVSYLVAEIQYNISNANTFNFVAPDGSTTSDGQYILNLLGVAIGQTGGGAGQGAAFIPNLSQVLAVGNDAGGNQLKNIADGTDPQDAVSKAQLDAHGLTDVLTSDNDAGGAQSSIDNIQYVNGLTATDSQLSLGTSAWLQGPSLRIKNTKSDGYMWITDDGSGIFVDSWSMSINNRNYTTHHEVLGKIEIENTVARFGREKEIIYKLSGTQSGQVVVPFNENATYLNGYPFESRQSGASNSLYTPTSITICFGKSSSPGATQVTADLRRQSKDSAVAYSYGGGHNIWSPVLHSTASAAAELYYRNDHVYDGYAGTSSGILEDEMLFCNLDLGTYTVEDITVKVRYMPIVDDGTESTDSSNW